MFGKLKDAARQANGERKIRQTLAKHELLAGASVTIRALGEQIRATVVLSDQSPLEGDQVKVLEAALNKIDGIDAVTVVATLHRTAAQNARVEQGHANPLALPGTRNITNADHSGEMRARPQRQRPGGATRVIAVASGKGGVGKSTISARLALALAAKGDRVGLLDLDIYGPSLPTLFDLQGVRPKVKDGMVIPLNAAGLSLMSIGFLVGEEQALAWRGPMVMGAAKQLLGEVAWGPLDWLVIDTPPGTGDIHLTLMQRTRIDGALIVSTPNPLALADVRRGAALFKKMDVPLLGLVENMARLDDGTMPFGDGISDAELISLDLPKLISLPLDSKIGGIIGTKAPAQPLTALEDLAEMVANRLLALDQADLAP